MMMTFLSRLLGLMKYQHKVIFGEVTYVDSRTTVTGKFIATARVRTEEGKMWQCNMWEELGQKFMSKDYTYQKVNFEGRLTEENIISVKFFDGDGSKVRPSIAKSKTEKELKEYAVWLELQGMVLVPEPRDGTISFIARAKKNCIKVNGLWHSKIEYVMQLLGAQEVTRRLRDFEGKLLDIEPKAYNERLDEMIKECEQL